MINLQLEIRNRGMLIYAGSHSFIDDCRRVSINDLEHRIKGLDFRCEELCPTLTLHVAANTEAIITQGNPHHLILTKKRKVQQHGNPQENTPQATRNEPQTSASDE